MNAIPELQPRRAPEPGRPFVNRGQELKLVRAKVERGIQGEQIPSPVICFWGAFGMGKSWLLGELERRHKYTVSKAQDACPTIAARLDLDRTIVPALWRGNQLDFVQLIREIWKQLASQMGESVPDRGRVSDEEWADDFVDRVTTWSGSTTPIIMLDTVDDLVTHDEASFFWLEQYLVERLAMTDRVLFVFASRGKLQRWRRYQVQKRVHWQKLSNFSPETAGQEVRASSTVSRELFRCAFGHPLVTEYLGSELESRGVDLQAGEEVEQLIEPSLAQAVLGFVVDEVLKNMPELPGKLARYTSVLRWVTIESLRSLAESLRLVEPDRGDPYYENELIGALRTHHLLYHKEKNRYESDPVLRRLFAYFLELNEPERFCEAHSAAFDFHCNTLSKYPQYLARSVPELAYHRAILDRCESPENLPTLRTWWEQFLSEKAPAAPGPWTDLVEALEQDEELQDILSDEDYEYLHSEAQRLAPETAG